MPINKTVVASVVALLFVLLVSCNQKPKVKRRPIDKKKVEATLAKINKKYIGVEDRQIDDYLDRRHWNFKRTKSGMRYLIYKKGQGKQAYSGARVTIEYELSLIRGNIIYSSKNLGDKTFEVDHSDEPTGLFEAIKLMRVGDHAKVVIPSYLAYGLLGDDKKIPPKATLFYDVYVKKVF